MKTEYRVVVVYQGFNTEFDDKLRKAVKKYPEGSGYGLGSRDICWYTNTAERAKALAAKLRAVKGKRKSVKIYKEEV